MIDSSGNEVYLVSAWGLMGQGSGSGNQAGPGSAVSQNPRGRRCRGPLPGTTAVLRKELLHHGGRLLRRSSRSEGTDINRCCFLRILEERKLS